MDDGVTTRAASYKDLVEFYSEDAAKLTVRAVAFDLGGKLVAVAGVRYTDGIFIVFSDIKSDTKIAKKTILRHALKTIVNYSTIKAPLYCVRDEDIPNSKRFIERLGFTLFEKTENGEVYRYGGRPSSYQRDQHSI